MKKRTYNVEDYKVEVTNKRTGETQTFHVYGDRLNIRKTEGTEEQLPEVVVEMLNAREGRKNETTSI